MCLSDGCSESADGASKLDFARLKRDCILKKSRMRVWITPMFIMCLPGSTEGGNGRGNRVALCLDSHAKMRCFHNAIDRLR
jgi:hypothetical protein